jgi:hypothetical protein
MDIGLSPPFAGDSDAAASNRVAAILRVLIPFFAAKKWGDSESMRHEKQNFFGVREKTEF